MQTKLKIALIALIVVIISIAVVWLFSSQEKPALISEKEITFSTGCTDIADLWTDLPQDKKIEECNKILNQQTADLKNMGFEPKDCKVIEAEANRCTGGMLGTQLVCTYTCEK